MGKFDGVLLASDFDSGAPVPPLPERNREALEYFMTHGGRFAIATGRALPAFLRHAGDVPMNAPGVVCNGAAIYDFEAGEYLETAMLNAAARDRGQAVLDRFPGVAVEAYHIDNIIHVVHPNSISRQHEHMTHVSLTEAPSLPEVPLPLGKLLFEADHETLENVLSFLTAQGWAEDYELIFSVSHLLEMTIKGASKGGMIRRLAARLGISMDHVYCAGDEANDLSMLRAANQGFAPANASAAVRESGVTVVCDAREGAIADIVEILDRKYS